MGDAQFRSEVVDVIRRSSQLTPDDGVVIDVSPGGLGTGTAPAATALTFENGSNQCVRLQWGTYFDAADQAGLSRLWCGIHVSVDDLTGRRLGAQCGERAWDPARKYFDGSVAQPLLALNIRRSTPGQCELGCDTIRGFFHKLQSTSDLDQPFTDDPAGFIQALDSLVRLDSLDNLTKFYRVIIAPDP